MRILVTGGAGFIGRFFCERLVGLGHEVSILDLVTPSWNSGEATVVQGDVRSVDAVRAALRDCHSVLHLAAAHHDFGIAPGTYVSVNQGGADVVCRVMDENGVRKACFFSSVAVYGDIEEPREEESPCRPSSAYGRSKLAAESVFRNWVGMGDGRSLLTIRPTVTFGPRNFANMYSLIRQIDSGRYLRVGKGTNIKSLAYVENLIEATLMLWRRAEAAPFEVYNYVDKPDLTSWEIAIAVSQALGRKLPDIRVPLSLATLGGLPFDLLGWVTRKNFAISSARIRKFAEAQTKFEANKLIASGFTPSVSLVEGINRMVAWYTAEGYAQKPVWHLPPAVVE